MTMKARTAALALTLAAATGVVALAGASSAAPSDASAVRHARLTLNPSSPALAACFPQAHAHVDVARTTDALGKDTFTVRAEHLKPRTSFTVFLLQQSGAPFGAAEYIGDVTTDAAGTATGSFKLIIEEAFAFNGGTLARAELNSVGMWFADQRADDSCLGAGSPVTGFDGDGQAGVQMLNSGTQKLP